jgi:hypothetical protein
MAPTSTSASNSLEVGSLLIYGYRYRYDIISGIVESTFDAKIDYYQAISLYNAVDTIDYDVKNITQNIEIVNSLYCLSFRKSSEYRCSII